GQASTSPNMGGFRLIQPTICYLASSTSSSPGGETSAKSRRSAAWCTGGEDTWFECVSTWIRRVLLSRSALPLPLAPSPSCSLAEATTTVVSNRAASHHRTLVLGPRRTVSALNRLRVAGCG